MKKSVRKNISPNDVRTPFKVTKILIVDDDSALIEVLEELFNEVGYRIKAINRVENIIPVIVDFQPDLVLLDYLLPFVNGGELCSQIKRNEATCMIPVILFSAYPKVLLSLGDYGCDAFIAKPFDLDSLLFHIEKCLENRQSCLEDKPL
jgi:two-component system, OmpR family, response regulator VicR